MLFHHLPSHLRRLTRGLATKPYYITTPIYYPNADPHIGHLYSLVIADVIARYQRLLNPTRRVEFLAGTDEHGLKIQKAAQAKGLPPNEFCDLLSTQFRRLPEKAHVTNTIFMRTTQCAHHETVQSVWHQLDAKGLIYKTDYSGWYSITDECFYTSSQVTTTPSPTSPATHTTIASETGSSVEWQSERNYMFRLSQFQSPLLEYYTSPENSGTIFPPQHHAHIVQILSSGPLEDLSISRPRSRLAWGVPVPGDPEQTIYVWFDALLVYLAGLGYPWKVNTALQGLRSSETWPVDLQVIGKDILRFHAIYFPIILKALDLPLQKRLLVHAHWTVDQRKMSKSIGNVVDPFQAMDEFGVDVIRFYLSRIGGRFRDDVDWSREQVEKHHKEIQSLLGNLLLRITSQTIRMRMASAPLISLSEIYEDRVSPNRELIQAIQDLPDKVKHSMDMLEVAEGLDIILDLLRHANKTVTAIAPWKKTVSPSEVYACHVTSVEVLRVAGICLQPFVPETARRLLDSLGVPVEERDWTDLEVGRGTSVGRVVGGVKLF